MGSSRAFGPPDLRLRRGPECPIGRAAKKAQQQKHETTLSTVRHANNCQQLLWAVCGCCRRL
eukprot:9004007-Alexandrium_andersonii.AAC.1